MNNRRYNDYSSYIKRHFSHRIQKISVNAGFTCPNRVGEKGYGGCTYCNNQSFNPLYTQTEIPIETQLDKGIAFFSDKYKTQKYLAYFQAYTNTYDEYDVLIDKYEQALRNKNVVGLVIGTRPDCMTDELLDYFNKKQKTHYVSIEYGVESTENKTLNYINRGHSYEESVEAIRKTAAYGIPTGAHLILGLPLENREIILGHARKLSALPLTTIKLHQLQLIRGTHMMVQHKRNPEYFHLYEADEYIDLVIDFLELLNPDFIVERFISQSPDKLLVAPKWGLKNFEFVAKVEKRLKERDTFQGRLYKVLA